jgi:HlyD family secretion protein
VAAAEAVVRRQQAEAQRLSQEVKRYAELLGKDAVTVQAEQLVRAQYDMAVASVAEAQERLTLIRAGARDEERAQAAAALAEAQAHLALVRAGPRKEAIEQARAQVLHTEESVKLVETRLGFTQVAAPLDGVVLAHHIEPGEFVAAGTPVITIGDVAHIWLRAYLPEPDLGRVKLGQPVRVTTDSQPGKVYAGQLAFISAEAEFTPKQIQTEKERVKLVYRVKITIPNETLALKPGMPADAVLEARGP